MTRGVHQPPPANRSQLLSLLTQACELEHGLACSYLYAAFSLKQDLAEGGVTWRDLQHVRLWAAQIFFVAAQEMLHLAQVWNLQAAIGGTPYYLRPNFPLPVDYYPLNLPVTLERFSLAALDRFIQYERPLTVTLQPETPIIGRGGSEYNSVGELYGLIEAGFTSIPNLFIGYPDRQVGPDLVDFPNIVQVLDPDSAVRAINLITEQGEGTETERDDCHYGMFQGIRRAYLQELSHASNEPSRQYVPVRPCINNPVASLTPVLHAPGAQEITHPATKEVARSFDSVYALMLRMLQYVFDNATGDKGLLREFSKAALELMTSTLKPLGEALMLMPAGSTTEYEGQTAGPGFLLTRHVPLPNEPAAARIVALEKLEEVLLRLERSASVAEAPRQLASAADNLRETARRLRGSSPPGDGATGRSRLGEAAGPDQRTVPPSTD